MYTSELHNAKESKEILEKGSPDIFVKWYHKKKKGPIHHPGVNTMKKSRLDQLEGRMGRIEGRMGRIEGRMGRIEGRMGRIEELIAKLAEKIDNLGNNLRNEMNAGFKQVNTRLDYIVKANDLKDLPKNSK